jgi:hypothetical protein
LGAQNEASGFAVEFTRQTGPQTTVAITSAIALSTGARETVRIGPKTSPNVPSEISRQIAVGFAPQTGPETGPKLYTGKPFGAALDTTP